MAPVHNQAPALSAGKTRAGVRQPQERREPGKPGGRGQVTHLQNPLPETDPVPAPPSQGTKVLQMFMWILNPRQVFDLSQGGPREA